MFPRNIPNNVLQQSGLILPQREICTMKTTDLKGTRPKQLIKSRDVGPEGIIQKTIENNPDQTKRQAELGINMRNPLYTDFHYKNKIAQQQQMMMDYSQNIPENLRNNEFPQQLVQQQTPGQQSYKGQTPVAIKDSLDEFKNNFNNQQHGNEQSQQQLSQKIQHNNESMQQQQHKRNWSRELIYNVQPNKSQFPYPYPTQCDPKELGEKVAIPFNLQLPMLKSSVAGGSSNHFNDQINKIYGGGGGGGGGTGGTAELLSTRSLQNKQHLQSVDQSELQHQLAQAQALQQEVINTGQSSNQNRSQMFENRLKSNTQQPAFQPQFNAAEQNKNELLPPPSSNQQGAPIMTHSRQYKSTQNRLNSNNRYQQGDDQYGSNQENFYGSNNQELQPIPKAVGTGNVKASNDNNKYQPLEEESDAQLKKQYYQYKNIGTPGYKPVSQDQQYSINQSKNQGNQHSIKDNQYDPNQYQQQQQGSLLGDPSYNNKSQPTISYNNPDANYSQLQTDQNEQYPSISQNSKLITSTSKRSFKPYNILSHKRHFDIEPKYDMPAVKWDQYDRELFKNYQYKNLDIHSIIKTKNINQDLKYQNFETANREYGEPGMQQQQKQY